MLGNLVSLSIGAMLGMLLLSSAGGLVMYFVLVLLVPNLTGLLAASQDWFKHLQPWVDLPFAQTYLFEGMHTGAQWAHVATAFTLSSTSSSRSAYRPTTRFSRWTTWSPRRTPRSTPRSPSPTSPGSPRGTWRMSWPGVARGPS